MFSYSPFHSGVFAKQEPVALNEPAADLNAINLLDYLFVSYPEYGRKEGQEKEKLVYFWPPDESDKRKLDLVSFSEAVINFTSEFGIENSSEHRFLTSQQLVSVILPVEGGFIIGAAFNKEKCEALHFFPHQGALLKTVKRIYKTFKLFNRGFEYNLKYGKDLMIEILDAFFTTYLPTVKLSPIPLIDVFDGISFMPLGSNLFLQTQCFVEQCMEQCLEIKQAMFLYQNKLAQFAVPREDLKTYYDLVVDHLIPSALKSELQPESVSCAQVGRFVKFAFDFAPSKGNFSVIWVKNSETREMERHYMVCYRTLNATMIMLIKETTQNLDHLLTRFGHFLSPRLCQLASEMAETVTETIQPVISGIPFHFIYYNTESKSFKTSLSSLSPSSSPITFSTEMSSAIYDVFDKFIECNDRTTEVNLKLESDIWVVFKKSTGRVLIVFIPNAQSTTLGEVEGHLNSIIANYFQHVHFS
ncbi:unnamed protein product [Bursaphelenchus xylophilus]|uniref:(pine wood nematode) hypothetical protein n=1 Tax=Bursaphelenchus xylophilus TaxID=6326 RepID=A0A1I7RSW2_BURXY|nr:unnamed protein product [Bursaphelenchus xylophilus]CAG9122779.1 unnamed protein product [Bursaphelenchus xylophilus]